MFLQILRRPQNIGSVELNIHVCRRDIIIFLSPVGYFIDSRTFLDMINITGLGEESVWCKD